MQLLLFTSGITSSLLFGLYIFQTAQLAHSLTLPQGQGCCLKPLRAPGEKRQQTTTRLLVLRLNNSNYENQNPVDANGDEGDDVNADADENNSPYKRRSLAWTNRYRRLIPYESARARAMGLGLRSKAEWDEYQENGESFEHGPYLPARPDLMYPDEWVSWDDFLGIMRPYEEARLMVRTLGIQTSDEYQQFVNNDKKRAEGLRIPAKPHIFYRNKGWTTFEDFFGSFD